MSPPRVALVDYGMGNLRSVARALEAAGARVDLTHSRDALRRASHVCVPGQGAFPDAMAALRRAGLLDVLEEGIRRSKPYLGICLGMQILFEVGEEFGAHRGLGIIPGRVVRFPRRRGLKVPHMGWNSLAVRPKPRVLRGLGRRPYLYFDHSYYCLPADPSWVAAFSRHGVDFCAAVEREGLFACQFHPEKSQALGLRVLENFLEAA